MAYCAHCGYAANLEKAEIPQPVVQEIMEENFLPMTKVFTPNVRTIEEVCNFLQIQPQDVIKTLIYCADGKPVAVLVRGDEEINDIKLKNYLRCDELEMAMDDRIKDVTGSPRGFVGPTGLKCKIIADYSIMNRYNFVAGANLEDHHLRNINLNRDFTITEYADLRVVREGDKCPRLQR